MNNIKTGLVLGSVLEKPILRERNLSIRERTVLNTLLCINRVYLAGFVTYLLTPWSRVLLEKLTGLELVKKFPAFYGIRRFLTALTSARHVSLS
jgi:hypothetical protein